MSRGRQIVRFVGVALLLVGVGFAWNPELVSKKAVPADPFEATERRVWWGLLIGFGLLLSLHRRVRPWPRTIAATCTALLLGLLAARLIGIALDGSAATQWINVGIELLILAPLVWWYLS